MKIRIFLFGLVMFVMGVIVGHFAGFGLFIYHTKDLMESVAGSALLGDRLKVRVAAQQFDWYFQYPGPDGRLGRVDPSLISEQNPMGIDGTDPAAADDVWSAELGFANKKCGITSEG